MKKLYILGISILAIGAVNAQTIFSTNFSNWAAGSLTDMGGSKTNIGAANILQVSTGATYGTNLVELVNTGSGHKRFSTLPLAIEKDTSYVIEIFAKGKGELRTGLFDGYLATNSGGYQPYGAYISINSATTTMYTQSVTSDTTTTLGEFILSIRNTVGANGNLQIDSMIVKKGASIAPQITTKTIVEIQSNVSSGDISYYKDSVVTTTGIVTAINYVGGVRKGYYLQDGTGPWTGIYVYHTSSTCERGDSLTITGTVTEYQEVTQISNITATVLTSSANDVIPTPISTYPTSYEEYESVLVKFTNANCTEGTDIHGNFKVDDGSGFGKVSDALYTFTPTVGTSYNVTGIMLYYLYFKVAPRDANDISTYTSVRENNSVLTNVYPNPTVSGLVNVEVTENSELVILDLLGNIVLSKNLTSTVNSVDVSTLAAGNYILKVGTSVQQLMVK